MSRVEAFEWEVAERALQREGGAALGVEGLAAAAERVCGKLGGALGEIIGEGGYTAVLQRALALARAAHPYLEHVDHPGDVPCLGGLPGALAGVTPEQARAGLTSLFAQAIGVISTLLDPDLVLYQVEQAWPEMMREAPNAMRERTE